MTRRRLSLLLGLLALIGGLIAWRILAEPTLDVALPGAGAPSTPSPAPSPGAAPPPPPAWWATYERLTKRPRSRASMRRALALVGALWAEDQSDVRVAREAARTACWLSMHAQDSQRKQELATRGIAYAKRVEAMAPTDPEGPYRRAVCLGLWMQENPLAGMRKVGVIEALAKKTVELDPTHDAGGGHRFLGLLYQKAPRFLVEHGPADHGRAHLETALELAPDDVGNLLNLAEERLARQDKVDARALIARAQARLARLPADVEIDGWRRRASDLARQAGAP